MTVVDVTIPRLAESISEATLVEWLKEDGAPVRVDEPIATLETDKAAVEIAATESGVLQHARQVGETVHVGDVLARIDADAAAGAASSAESQLPAGVKSVSPSSAPARPPDPPSERRKPEQVAAQHAAGAAGAEPALSPAVRKMVEEHSLDPAQIEATGRGGRLLKEDVLRHLERHSGNGSGGPGAKDAVRPAPASAPGPVHRASSSPDVPAKAASAPAPDARATTTAPAPRPAAAPPAPVAESGSDERLVPMSRIRQRIAERLVQAQHTAAILTTFNEIDMSAVLDLRARHKDTFEKKHGVKLGFMSFFARASVAALTEIPELNAEIRGTDIVYRRRVHLGVAVGTERGLVVPVVRDADQMGFAEIEREIARLADRARDHTLSLQELSGGTFTISNGGVYGSLFSTPILNPPQSGILGMHKIEKRPVALNDQVAIRPMMYVALSYDHRIVDGEQAVTFLVRVKERIEVPERLLLDV